MSQLFPMQDRRAFMKNLGLLGAAAVLPTVTSSQPLFSIQQKEQKIWSFLLHLSFNMWSDSPAPRPDLPEKEMLHYYQPSLVLSEKLWTDSLQKMAEEGLNTVVIDLGNAIQYESHPEIAVRNAWSVERLRKELDRIRGMGIEPIPKLNFSAGHDAWLTQYHRMVSTPKYYEVCSDLIREVGAIFDQPQFFHIGMDEETAGDQKKMDLVVVRQNNLFWGDLYFLISEVEKAGMRPWMWNGPSYWNTDEKTETFYKKMPKSVLQNNWYNWVDFSNEEQLNVKGYLNLDAGGYDQIVGGSTYYGGEHLKSIMNNVQFGTKRISNKHLKGFIQTSWRPTVEVYRDEILNSIHLMGQAKRWYDDFKA